MDELADTEKEFPDRVYEMQASLVHNVLMFIEVQNKEGMIEFLKDYHPADIADLFEQIKPTQRSALVELWGRKWMVKFLPKWMRAYQVIYLKKCLMT